MIGQMADYYPPTSGRPVGLCRLCGERQGTRPGGKLGTVRESSPEPAEGPGRLLEGGGGWVASDGWPLHGDSSQGGRRREGTRAKRIP